MKKYTIRYTETYARDYEIEATSQEAAKEELEFQIINGWLDGPEECYDSIMSVIDEEEIE